jgi:Cu-processing system permease protein
MEAILSIAKKEVMDNIRTKSIVTIIITFVTIAIISSLMGAAFKGFSGLGDLRMTVSMMMMFIQYVIPIIGVMLGYASIVGEAESGTLSAFISFPVTRLEIILGKFFGLGLVLSAGIFLGFGIAGIIIGFSVSTFDYGLYLIYILYSILLGLVFLSISMFFSSVFKKRSTALGMSIFTWSFFSFLWGMLLIGLLFANHLSPSSVDAGGYFALNLFSPAQAYNALVALSFGAQPLLIPSAGLSTFPDGFPDFYNAFVLIFLMTLWIVIMLIFSYLSFRYRDV